jgi:predicted dehydrogenase
MEGTHMRVGIVGLGSIGQRHVINIRKYCGDVGEILAYRQHRSLSDLHGAVPTHKNFLDHYNVETTFDIDRFLGSIDRLIVCNPTSEHMTWFNLARKHGVPSLIEKPLHHDMPANLPTPWISSEPRPTHRVGYQLRYDPGFLKMKEMVSDGWLHADIVWHEHLPSAHPWENFRDGYAARKDLGGGVISCYSHEIDYALQLFGKPTHVSCIVSNSTFNLDVEETAVITMYYTGNRTVTCDLSFVPYVEKRQCRVTSQDGRIQWDVSNQTIATSVIPGGNTVWYPPEDDEYTDSRNANLVAELRDFLFGGYEDCHPCGISEALNVCAVIHAAKVSALNHTTEDVVYVSCA